MFKEKQSTHSQFSDIAAYPPTLSAAAVHSMRMYWQKMEWIGIHKDPLHWAFVIITDFTCTRQSIAAGPL